MIIFFVGIIVIVIHDYCDIFVFVNLQVSNKAIEVVPGDCLKSKVVM